MAHQRGFLHTQGVQQGGDKSGGFLHRLRCFTRTFAVARQVGRQHVPAVVGEVACLQNPDAVVIEHAMDEDHGGLGGIKRFAAGVAISCVAVDGEVHDQDSRRAAPREAKAPSGGSENTKW